MAVRSGWVPDPSRVLVVPAGRGAREQATALHAYHSQNRRAFRPCRWIAFYARGIIDAVAELEGAPEDDVLIAQRPELAALSAKMGAGASVPHTLFRLKNVRLIGPITNDALDKNGDRTAWVQAQRYTTIDRLLAARRTSEL